MTAYRRPKAPEPFDAGELVGMVATFEALPTRYVWDRQIKSATRPVEKMAKYVVEHAAAIAVQLDAARALYEGLTSGADNECYQCKEFPGSNPKCDAQFVRVETNDGGIDRPRTLTYFPMQDIETMEAT